ncbi:MAG TPA: GAF domain-containing protein [Aggregatilineales bacterium]|nr:GAF domain-containing protein [Aggregatilineales bacterium]
MGSFVMSPEVRSVISDQDRLKALMDLALIDADEETVFNRLTDLASRIVGAPISVMSMVGNDYQFFKSAVGIGDLKSTPLSHSFCKHVVADSAPLVVDDARQHPVLHDNGAIKDLNVIGYLGFPLKIASGKTLGSFCVIDNQPRHWSDEDIEIMRELAEMVKYEIEARALFHKAEIGTDQLEDLHNAIIAFADRIDPTAPKAALVEQIRSERQQLFAMA